jgi:cell division transport system permease protein
MGFLTFLAVSAGGVILSISNAVGRFNANLDRTGIIQVMRGMSADAAKKIINENKSHIASVKEVDKGESAKLLKNWLHSADALSSYIPEMFQIRAKTTAGLDIIAKRAEAEKLRFVYGRHASPDRGVGIRIMLIAGIIFAAVLGSLAVCIIHSVRNIIMLHKREIEILDQVGATPGYIARQIQTAMLGLSAGAGAAGLLAGGLLLLLANGLSGTARVGLLANMGLNPYDWLLLLILTTAMTATTAIITHRVTLKILAK